MMKSNRKNNPNIKYVFILGFIAIIISIHLLAISIKNKISIILEALNKDESDVVYDALVLENYGLLSNIIFLSSVVICILTFIFCLKNKVRRKHLISILVSLVFLILELIFYNSFF